MKAPNLIMIVCEFLMCFMAAKYFGEDMERSIWFLLAAIYFSLNNREKEAAK